MGAVPWGARWGRREPGRVLRATCRCCSLRAPPGPGPLSEHLFPTGLRALSHHQKAGPPCPPRRDVCLILCPPPQGQPHASRSRCRNGRLEGRCEPWGLGPAPRLWTGNLAFLLHTASPPPHPLFAQFSADIYNLESHKMNIDEILEGDSMKKA